MATGMETKEKKPRLSSAGRSQLPTLDELRARDPDQAAHVRQILAEMVEVKAAISAGEERAQELKIELHAVCEAYGLDKGFKDGMAAWEHHGYRTQSRLDREKLVSRLADWGVPASVVEESYAEGTPFIADRLVVFDVE